MQHRPFLADARLIRHFSVRSQQLMRGRALFPLYENQSPRKISMKCNTFRNPADKSNICFKCVRFLLPWVKSQRRSDPLAPRVSALLCHRTPLADSARLEVSPRAPRPLGCSASGSRDARSATLKRLAATLGVTAGRIRAKRLRKANNLKVDISL